MGAVSADASRPWPAPAKLNLFLHILGRRPDGYHELQTAFQFIDLCDELSFQPRDDGRIVRVEGPGEVAEQEDLVVRAAHCLLTAAQEHRLHTAGATGSVPAVLDKKLGVSIALRKRIPMQAGLGGGSSDAATTLVALNALWGLGFTLDDLARLGLELGADVPVFLRGSAAWAEGVGERLQAIQPPENTYVVIRPDCAVNTREIFQAAELTRNSPRITLRAFFEEGGRNDCEPVVRARYPKVGAALDWLGRYAPARLTGTGSCVFAALEDKARAAELLAALPAGWQGFWVRGLNRSPLFDR